MNACPAGPGASRHDYSPTRRTAVLLVGEGTSVAYQVGALKALMDAGVRIDLLVGKGAGALVAAFGAVQAGEKLWGRSGLVEIFSGKRPWRWRSPYLAVLVCLAVAFGVFVSPALLGILLLFTLPLLAAARIVAPAVVDRFFEAVQEHVVAVATQLDPIYLRAMAFPVACLFALLLVGWVAPSVLARQARGRGIGRLLGEGVIDLSPLEKELERNLWEAVRGASIEPRPPRRRDMGLRYRELLSSSLGQLGYCELIFYALDLESGQEVPFVLLKERWLSRLRVRGPGEGAVATEPVDLAGDGGTLFFDALMASLTPPALAPSVLLRLPLEGRFGGEIHRFASSVLAGQSAVSDALAAGAQQIIYVSGAPATGDSRLGPLERLADAVVRQALENDLRAGERDPTKPALFIVRPDKPWLGTFEFFSGSVYGEERPGMTALVARGERDMTRMFIQPLVGETRRASKPGQTGRSGRDAASQEFREMGPKEL